MSKYTLKHSTPTTGKEELPFTPFTPSAPITPIENIPNPNVPDNFQYSYQSPTWAQGYNIPPNRRVTTAELKEAGVVIPQPRFEMFQPEHESNLTVVNPNMSDPDKTLKAVSQSHYYPSHMGSHSSSEWFNEPSHSSSSGETFSRLTSNHGSDPFMTKHSLPLQPAAQTNPAIMRPPDFGSFTVGPRKQPSPEADPVTNMALHYGNYIVGSSKEVVNKEIKKYVALSRLKYYFAVDTAYVLYKLMLLLFPFTHKDWSLRYSQNEPLQPRHDINAPDLYIPVMAYVTYVLVAGLALGTQNRFSPEALGICASQALAWLLVEVFIQLATLYISNIQYNMRTLDIIAYSGYKFAGILLSILVSLVLGVTGYIVTILYTSMTLIIFLVRTLKFQMLVEKDPGNFDNNYDSPTRHVYTPGNKRKMYFMISVALLQPLLMWCLSYHLIAHD